MNLFFSLFSRSFDLFSRHRVILYAVTALVIAAALLSLGKARLSEDINPMLPGRASVAAADFRILEQAPFVKKVVFSLRADPGTDQKALIQAADRLAAALAGPYYGKVVTGTSGPPPEEFLPWLLKSAPAMMTEEDLEALGAKLVPDRLGPELEGIKERLNGPDGFILKTLFREDPLGASLVALGKFRHLNMFQGMNLVDNHFVSADGSSCLIVADTPVRLTDTDGSKKLVHFTRKAIETSVPSGITVSFLSGHLYTAANAEAIRKDLSLILSSASIAILLLLFLFIRNARALLVFLVPMSVVVIATAGIMLACHEISAITIAFGSVLMGIADDYPIFTYFSLRNRGLFSGEAVAAVSRPVLMSAVTTMATFSALFFSDLPGQRQIALFSLMGITASLIFSLLLLPHLVQGMPLPKASARKDRNTRTSLPRGIVIGVWTVVVGLCLWQACGLSFNGDMRSVSTIPPELRETEKAFRETWGDFRGKAMIVTEAPDTETALVQNERLFAFLRGHLGDREIVSIAPILPSSSAQEAGLKRWQAQWTQNKRAFAEELFHREGEKNGFSPQAFDPFFKRLKEPPVKVSLDDLRKVGISDIIDSLMVREGGVYRIFTLIPDTAATAVAVAGEALSPFKARYLSQRRFSEVMGRVLVRNFITYIVTASGVIVFFLILLFRQAGKVLLALVPVATGLAFMFGAMGFRGMEINLFNIIAAILVIGLSVDLGIFMVSRMGEGYDRDTGPAVLLSGLTSLVGMGALSLARHPALHSIGITVLLGMCGAIPSALLVIPAFHGLPRRDKDQEAI